MLGRYGVFYAEVNDTEYRVGRKNEDGNRDRIWNRNRNGKIKGLQEWVEQDRGRGKVGADAIRAGSGRGGRKCYASRGCAGVMKFLHRGGIRYSLGLMIFVDSRTVD